MVARHRNDILVVTDLEKVLYDDAVDRAASHSQAGVSTSGNNHPSAFLELMTAGKHPVTLTGTISHRNLARRCRSSQLMKYMCMLRIVTGLPCEHFQFLIYCVVISHSSLPSARYLIMHSGSWNEVIQASMELP